MAGHPSDAPIAVHCRSSSLCWVRRAMASGKRSASRATSSASSGCKVSSRAIDRDRGVQNLSAAIFIAKVIFCDAHRTAQSLVWKATKEYLNQRGTKIRVFRVCFRAPFLPPFSPHFSLLFPLQALFTFPPLLPSSPPPLSPLFRLPKNSDFGTPLI